MKKRNMKRDTSDMSGGGMAAKLLKMQKEMRKTRKDLAGEKVTSTAGDGAVEIVVSGDQRVQEIRIAPELLENSDSANVASLLVTASKDAMDKSQTLAARRLRDLTGGLGLPGQ